jgi:diguanylate cyclase (GGDEF)-like protein
MPELFDRIADLTGYRDRDVIDVTLVTAVRDILQPQALSMYRPVGEPGAEVWSTRARMDATSQVPTADSLWTSGSPDLPRLVDHPARYLAYTTQQVVQVPGTPHRTLFPLSTDRDVIGVLDIETEEPLSAQQQRVAHSVLRIYRNFLGLLDYSERDTLTGLLNRKTFDEAFLKAVATLQRPGDPAVGPIDGAQAGDARRLPALGGYWLGVIDIDHFKRVNDGFGHLIGDEVLLLLARLLRSSFRGHDLLFRFGGEEFVVLVRCERGADAAGAFERLRSNTEGFAFPQVGQITVSVGYTQIKAGDTPSSAFERADKAVYYAKGHGRNQVHCHADLVAAGELEVELPKGGAVELF